MTSKRKSGMIEKRSSHSATSSSRKRSSLSSARDRQLSSISEIEEVNSMAIVQPIMDEILEAALDDIHKTYMDRQSIKFVVHCAHCAMEKFLRFYFYQHNEYQREYPFWGPDPSTPPSPPDSWALGQIPLYKEISTEIELNTLSKIALEMAAKGTPMRVDSRMEMESQPSESLLEDIKGFLDDIIDNLPLDEIDAAAADAESQISEFSCVVEGKKHYNEFKAKPQISKITIGDSTIFKLPKIEVKELAGIPKTKVCEEMPLSSEHLPPIRTDAKYKTQEKTQEVEGKKPSKTSR